MKRLDDFMDDARHALAEWNQIEWREITAKDRIPLETLLGKVRKKVMEVYADFANSDMTDQYRDLKERYEKLSPKGR